MKLLTVLLPLLTAVVLVPTAVSRPLITDPTTGPALLGEPRSIGQASHFPPQPVQLDTNAKRFAKGLPPLAPSKSRRYKASPVRRTGASPLPPVTYTSCSGVIEVFNSDNGDPIGYLSSLSSGSEDSALYQVQTDLDSNALRVHFNIPGGATGTVTDLNIVAENSNLPNAAIAPYVGLAYWGDLTVSSGPHTAYMAATVQTSAGSPPTVGANSWTPDAKIESAVWTVDVSTWSLTLKWINPDGSLAPGLAFSRNNQILFGDREWWASFVSRPGQQPDPVVGVSFKFVPAEDLLQ